MDKTRRKKSKVYAVEKLVGSRIKCSKLEYLVKWKNWSVKHNTWEPETNILDKRLIESFHRSRKRHKNINSPNADGANENLSENVNHEIATKSATLIANEPSDNLPKSLPELSTSESTGTNINKTPFATTSSMGPSLPTSPTTTSTGIRETVNTIDILDCRTDRCLRKTTLIVAAASASAAQEAAERRLATKIVDYKQPCYTSDKKQFQPVTTTEMERPKIRLKIPKNLLFPCQQLSIKESCFPRKKNSPIEASRCAHDSISSLIIPNSISIPEILEYENNNRHTTPSFTLFDKVRTPGEHIYPRENCINQAKMHLASHCNNSRRLKKKRRRLLKESLEIDIRNRSCSSGSGSSSSSCISCTSSSTTSSTFSSEQSLNNSPPRLAPLRIQLSRSNSNSTRVQLPGPNVDVNETANIRMRKYCCTKDFIPIEHDISITDVTVGGLTITIKESNTPKNFFGRPSFQIISRKPLVPKVVQSTFSNKMPCLPLNQDITVSRNECSDENLEPTNGNSSNSTNTGIPQQLSVIMEESSLECTDNDLKDDTNDYNWCISGVDKVKTNSPIESNIIKSPKCVSTPVKLHASPKPKLYINSSKPTAKRKSLSSSKKLLSITPQNSPCSSTTKMNSKLKRFPRRKNSQSVSKLQSKFPLKTLSVTDPGAISVYTFPSESPPIRPLHTQDFSTSQSHTVNSKPPIRTSLSIHNLFDPTNLSNLTIPQSIPSNNQLYPISNKFHISQNFTPGIYNSFLKQSALPIMGQYYPIQEFQTTINVHRTTVDNIMADLQHPSQSQIESDDLPIDLSAKR